jgi:hypothetical protein
VVSAGSRNTMASLKALPSLHCLFKKVEVDHVPQLHLSDQ